MPPIALPGDDDLNVPGGTEKGALDTGDIIPTRLERKRSQRNCVCCGLNCALFCKALGIAILLLVAWYGFKLTRWIFTPSPTGLEGMPEYNVSLGCSDASYFFQENDEGTLYTIAPSENGADHEVHISGSAVGTILIAPSETTHDSSIKIHARIASNDATLIPKLQVATPGSSAPKPDGVHSDSYFALTSPDFDDSEHTAAGSSPQCMRYDLTVFVPRTLRGLTISVQSVAQVKFSDAFAADPRELGSLKIKLADADARNMVLPSGDLVAENALVCLKGGYLVGELALANSTDVRTACSSAITKLTVRPTAYTDDRHSEGGATAYLSTLTGSGRSDFVFENPIHRPIYSEHDTCGEGDLYLTYERANFNGVVDIEAASKLTAGVYSDRHAEAGETKSQLWAGDKEGGDFMKVRTWRNGWVGLYFTSFKILFNEWVTNLMDPI